MCTESMAARLLGPAAPARRNLADEVGELAVLADAEPGHRVAGPQLAGDRRLEPELLGLAQAEACMDDRTYAAGQRDFTEEDGLGRQRRVGERGDERGGNRQVSGGL